MVPDVLQVLRSFKTAATTHQPTQHHISKKPEASKTLLWELQIML